MTDDDARALREQLEQRTRELRASEERLRNLITRNADSIVVVDGAGQVRFINPAAEALFGRPAAELVGTLFGFPVVAGETTELDVVGSGGAVALVEMRVMATEWGRQPALLAVLRDVTERKRAEEQRAQLIGEQAARAAAEDALRVRDEFLSIAAHELRNPVTGIKGTSELLLRYHERGQLTDDRLQRLLRSIGQASAHLGVLVDDLLDVSRLQSGQLRLHPRPTDLAAVVREAASARQRLTRAHRLIVEGLTAPCIATVDPDRIEQVLANLIDNAVKYSPAGGEVRIGLARDGEGVRIRVQDGGIGLPDGVAEALFRPFGRAPNAAQRNLPGLGLGLYICRQIVESHGGRIWAESAGEDRGTTFHLRLPLNAPTVDGEHRDGLDRPGAR